MLGVCTCLFIIHFICLLHVGFFFLFVQVLLLTGQFEMAIEFMLKYETMVPHAVHMALALYERRLLNVSTSGGNGGGNYLHYLIGNGGGNNVIVQIINEGGT